MVSDVSFWVHLRIILIWKLAKIWKDNFICVIELLPFVFKLDLCSLPKYLCSLADANYHFCFSTFEDLTHLFKVLHER